MSSEKVLFNLCTKTKKKIIFFLNFLPNNPRVNMWWICMHSLLNGFIQQSTDANFLASSNCRYNLYMT